MKRILLIIGLLLACAGQGRAALVVNSCAGGGTAAVSASVTVNISPTNGDSLDVGIVSFTNPSSQFVSLQDNNLNNFTLDNSGWINPNNFIRYAHLSNVSGVTSVKLTLNTSTQDFGFIVCDVGGQTNSSPGDVFDNTGSFTNSATTWTTPSITTTNANDIVFGFVVTTTGGYTFAASGSWTLGSTQNISGTISFAMVYQVVSSATAWQPSGTVSPTGSASLGELTASYKAGVTAAAASTIGGPSSVGGPTRTD